jgi:hypothetical protein
MSESEDGHHSLPMTTRQSLLLYRQLTVCNIGVFPLDAGPYQGLRVNGIDLA